MRVTSFFARLSFMIRMEPIRSTVFAAAFAAWFGTVLASIACAGELAISKTVPWGLAFPAMANIHMLIGVGEGLATGLVVLAVLRTRPQLILGAPEDSSGARTGLIGYGLLVALGLAVFVAPFACRWPDGLDSVARVLGFESQATAGTLASPFADYRLPFIGSTTLATAVAGAIGTVLAFIAAYALARMLVPALTTPKKDATSGD